MDIPPALVLGCNTPHGLGVISDWIEEQTGITPDFSVTRWADGNSYADSVNFGPGAGFCFGSGGGYGCGYGYSNGNGSGSGDDVFRYTHTDGDGYGFGYSFGLDIGRGMGSGSGYGAFDGSGGYTS